MSTANRIKSGGLAALLAGLLYWVGWPGAAEVLPVVSHVAGHWLFALAGLLSIFGLVGLIAFTAGRSGRLGKAGIIIGFIGAALVCIGNAAEAILVIHKSFSWTSQVYALGWLGTIIGLILLGIGALRGQGLPRWNALSLIIAPLSFFAIYIIGAIILVATGNTSESPVGNMPLTILNYIVAVVFGIPWIIMGYTLWSSKGDITSKGV